ncbi:Fibronectin type III domain-containing protein [Jatrophihabitans endophyticus]|uniref:Fibronectin type III domain-containing protein n=1 Tax=Jatrophihabitans endophyticus TaxID=1206085 RepID=A0A1M5Q8S1_9ACTN|nr:fibronectin type III domain-containing protein [Jatrophihabitans endophyticus]SHH10587.1 Fibronectin type III domain-containing protein [Jatrophihabitans endophyticus]
MKLSGFPGGRDAESRRPWGLPGRRAVSLIGAASTVLAGAVLAQAPSAAADSPCADGSTPALLSSVTCNAAGNYTLTVPGGTTDVDVDAIGGGGGAGYPARSHIGGNAAEVTGNLTLPAGTAYLYVIVGTGGSGDNHGSGIGGGASAVLAEDSGHNLIAKLVVAGAGGSGAYNGDGGNAGSAGTSENTSLSNAGTPGIGATGGAGGTGNYAAGSAGGTNNPSALTVAAGGNGGGVPGGAYGGGGGGGYGGGGGGGGGTSGVLTRNVAGGGGGSSLASAYLGAAAISVKSGTGGVQLPGLVAGDGATGTVTLTFNGLATPGTPTGVTATPGDGKASVSFTAPGDNGSPITSYTVTASPGGTTKTCPGSPCVIGGLTDGTSYTFTVHATNANGDSAESSASNAVTPAMVPGAPTGVSATAGDAQASVSFTAPASNGGASITSYTVTSSPGGITTTCPGSPCTVGYLDNGTSYTFTVHATNGIGDGPESAASAAVTPVGVPNGPGDVTLTPGDERFTASFPVPDANGAPITGYQVSLDGGQTWQTLDATSANGTVTGTVTGLMNGVTYSVQLRAVNYAGTGWASKAQDVTPASKPGAPTGAVATAGDGQASVSFTAPYSDGGAVISSYTVTASPGGASATCPGSPCTVTGLDNGTTYTFTVRATNDIGDSPESAASAAVTPVGPPSVPTDVTFTPGNERIDVSFPVPGDGGSAIAGYQYTLDGGQTWSTLNAAVANGKVTGTVTELVNGTTYAVRVRAVNANGPGDASDAQSVTPATVPHAPTGVTAQRGDHSISVSFTVPDSNGGAPVTSYRVTTSPGGKTAVCGSTPCVVDGLTNGTSYTVTVAATNDVGTSVESAASNPVTPASVPDVPTDLVVQPGNQQAVLTFGRADNNGSPITGYEYSLGSEGTWQTLTTTGSGTLTGTVTGLTNGTEYKISVRAVNAVGAGLPAKPVRVTPAAVADAPKDVHAMGDDGKAVVYFTAPASDGGSAITSYTATASPGGASVTCPGSPCTVPGLKNGTAYTFTVHATNKAGDSPESAASQPITPAGAPIAPAKPTLEKATATSVTVSFPPADDNGLQILKYQYSTDGGDTWTTLDTQQHGDRLVATVTGLQPGTGYKLVVRALNEMGTSDPSPAVAVATTPAAVTVPAAKAGVSSVLVSWPRTQGDDATTGYTVYASPGKATCSTSSRTDTSCVIGATAGVRYRYVVVAHSAGGDAVPSAASAPAVASAPKVPAATPAKATKRLTTPSGALHSVRPGQRVTLVGTGFLPRSSVTLVVYGKHGTVLRKVVTDAKGAFRAAVRSPKSADVRRETFVALGVTNAGSTRAIRMPVSVAQSTGWFTDPMTKAQRRHLATVPAHPSSARGKARMTKAWERTHGGKLAVPVTKARGHQLTKGQAVQLTGLFAFDSARLSAKGRQMVRTLAHSLKSAHGITCEGYADYAGPASRAQRLSVDRARVVCAALRHYHPGLHVKTVGYGNTRPVVIGGTRGERAANRRVDVLVPKG